MRNWQKFLSQARQQKCKKERFFVGMNFIPVLPFLSDSEEQLDEMICAAKKYGADFVFVGALTLFGNGPYDCKTLYYKFLEKHYPDLVPKYKALYKGFFAPSRGYQRKLKEVTKKLCKKHGIKNAIC